jgi:hypothetical protein
MVAKELRQTGSVQENAVDEKNSAGSERLSSIKPVFRLLQGSSRAIFCREPVLLAPRLYSIRPSGAIKAKNILEAGCPECRWMSCLKYLKPAAKQLIGCPVPDDEKWTK